MQGNTKEGDFPLSVTECVLSLGGMRGHTREGVWTSPSVLLIDSYH